MPWPVARPRFPWPRRRPGVTRHANASPGTARGGTVNTTMNARLGQVLVLYGITGDLAKKMIIPALYRLTARGVLDVPVIGVSRDDLDLAGLRRHVHESVAAACGQVDEGVFDALTEKLDLVAGDVTDAATFTEIGRRIGDTAFAVHYLAVPPPLFTPIARGLDAAGLNTRSRLVVEKPFG